MKNTNWSVPRIFEGQTCAVLASGESMSQTVADQVRQSGVRCVAVNNNYQLAPWADVVYAADARWWQVYQNKGVMKCSGLKVCAESVMVEGVETLKNTGCFGFDPDRSCIRTGGNSGYQGIHLAAHAGASRILLCGFDMHGGHWHPDHDVAELLRNPDDARFLRWIPRFTELAQELSERGIEVLNCTPGSAIKCFPFESLENALSVQVREAA